MLVDALLERDALALLVHRLAAFDEGVAEEAAAVNNLLGIFENLVEVKPEVAELVVQKTKVRGGTGGGERYGGGGALDCSKWGGARVFKPTALHVVLPPALAAAQVAAGPAAPGAQPRGRRQQAVRLGAAGHPGAAVGWVGSEGG